MKKSSVLYSIALILDFSSPQIAEFPKQSFPADESVIILSYATSDEDKPSKCGYARMKTLKSSQFDSWFRGQSPQRDAPLPLGEAIRKIRFEIDFDLRKITDVIIVSSGKDTCGDDPCEAFRQLDRSASVKKRQIRIHPVLGLNCGNQQQWKSLAWQSPRGKDPGASMKAALKIASGPPPAGFHRRDAITASAKRSDVKRSDEKSSEKDTEKSRDEAESYSASEPNAPESNEKENSGGLNGADGSETPSKVVKKEGVPLATADLVIEDAPEDLRFKAVPLQGSDDAATELTWRGPEKTTLAEGRWSIRIPAYPSVEKILEVKPNEHTLLKYYRDFQLPRTKLKLKGPPLELRFDPVNSQNEGKHVRLRSGAHGGAPIGLPPGNWNVVVEAPSWVTSLPAIPFLAEPGVARDFSIEQIWEDELDFVETTKTDEMLLVLGEDGQGKRILIPAASPALPVLKSETWKLIRLRTIPSGKL